MRVSVAAMAAGAALVLAGCGGSASDQVSAKVQQLAQAADRHDYTTICQQVLAPSLIAHLVSNGIPCERAMQIALEGVEQPVVSVGKVEVNGSQATAITLTVARGQQASLAAIELIKTSQGWRISSLGTPLSPTGTAG